MRELVRHETTQVWGKQRVSNTGHQADTAGNYANTKSNILASQFAGQNLVIPDI